MIRHLLCYFRLTGLKISIAFGSGGTPDSIDLLGYPQPLRVPLREWIVATTERSSFYTRHPGALTVAFFPEGSIVEGQEITLQLSSSERFQGRIEKTTIMDDVVYVVTLLIE